MQLIQHIEVGSGGAASITFSAIAGDYTDLYLVAHVRSNRASPNVGDDLKIDFNGSSADFTSRTLAGDGSSAFSFSSDGRAGIIPAEGSTALTFASVAIYIPNYAEGANKSYSVDAVGENNATAANQAIVAGLWSQTAAITSLALYPRLGTGLVEFSSASLYGITAGSDGVVAVS